MLARPLRPGSGCARSTTRSLACMLLALAALLPSCKDDPQAPVPGVPAATDYRGLYDAGAGRLEFRLEAPDGSLSAFRLVAAGLEHDVANHLVRARVAVRNTSSAALPGPRTITVSDFVPEDVRPMNAACVEYDCLNCPLVCSFDHSGTYGEDGVLEPGETSEPVEWVFLDPSGQSFAFCARFVPDEPQPGAGEISGFVFGDLNGDGRRQEGESGIGGQTLALIFGSTEQTAQTDASGHYAFAAMEPGLYEVMWDFQDPSGGCQPTTPTRLQVLILRRPDGSLSGFPRGDFGCLAKPVLGVPVGGVVFADENRNGVQDPGEAGLPRVLVVGAAVLCPTFAPIEARTDERGRYMMQLPSCDPPFEVYRAPIAGTMDTTPNPVVFHRLPPDQGMLVANFGVAREDSAQTKLAVEGVVFLEANRNGARDRGEAGVASVEVSASGLECTLPVVGITRTDENGHYRLRDTDVLCPLPWVVKRHGVWLDTTPNPVILYRPPPNGTTTFVVDFGVVPPDSLPPDSPAIFGVVFADWDRDGVRDPNEPGIPAVEVQLQSPCRLLRATRTGRDGSYRFAPETVAVCPVQAVWQSMPRFPEHTTPNPWPLDPAAGDRMIEANFGVVPGRMQP